MPKLGTCIEHSTFQLFVCISTNNIRARWDMERLDYVIEAHRLLTRSFLHSPREWT